VSVKVSVSEVVWDFGVVWFGMVGVDEVVGGCLWTFFGM